MKLSLILVGFLLAASNGAAKRFDILVNAEADEEYMAKAEKLEYQTYHLLKGKYHGGSTRDKSLESTEFEDLFESLLETLKKRDLYPEPDTSSGDLLVMVSWGRTSLDPDWGELQVITGSGDMSSEAAAGEAYSAGNIATASGGENATVVQSQSAASTDMGGGLDFASGSSSQRSQNIALLGLDGKSCGHNPLGYTPDEDLWGALEEERYFVILNAFDYQHLLEEKELKQVWRVRYNTRAVGVGFENAFESMNEAVAGVIGLQVDEITKVKGDTRGSISMGEVQMVEMNEAEKKEMKQ